MVAITQINLGTNPNDGTGDTLRQAGQKINDNFYNLNTFLGDIDAGIVKFTLSGLEFTGQNHSTFLNFDEDINGDTTIVLPPLSGNIVIDNANQDVSNKTLLDVTLKNSILDTNGVLLQLDEQNPTISKILRINTNGIDSDHFVLAGASQALSNKTLENPILNNPIIIDKIKSNFGTTVIDLHSEALSQQNIRISNAAADTGISIISSNLNADMNLSAKGSGTIHINSMLSFEKDIITTDNNILSLSTSITEINSESNLTSLTLPAGNNIGSRKVIINTNVGSAQVEFTNLNVVNESVVMSRNAIIEVLWTGDKWLINSPKIYTQSDNALWYAI